MGTVGIQAPEERRSPAGQDATMRTDENSSNMAEFYGISKDFYGISKDFYGISMDLSKIGLTFLKWGCPTGWMVYSWLGNLMKMDDFGGPLCQETTTFCSHQACLGTYGWGVKTIRPSIYTFKQHKRRTD